MQNITSLIVEGVKRIKAVRIDADGKNVIIGGRNAQGKTSVLDAIEMVLGGKKTIPPRPIHDGTDTARVVVEMDDLIITRTFTAKGSYLKVTTKDGASYPGAQAMLDSMIGKLALDPHRFANMKPDEQAAMLREMVGVDTSELDTKRAELYEKRRDTNRQIKEMEAKISGMPVHDDVPDAPVVVQDLMQRLQDADTHNAQIKSLDAQYAELLRQIDAKRDQIDQMQNDVDQMVGTINRIDEAKKEKGDLIDTAPIRDEINGAQEVNRKVQQNADRELIEASLGEHRMEHNDLNMKIESIDEQKDEMLRGAAYPIDGLGIDDEGRVIYNGVPFEQASGAERLRVSAAIGLALNPKMGVLLIRDGSLLDAESMRDILEYADERGAQVFIERVGTDDDGAVIIEDGEVLVQESDLFAQDGSETT